MGCLKLTYYPEFLSLWKETAIEKSDHVNFLPLGEKSAGKENCIDYYPFGLTFNSYSRENSIENNFLFNGFEKQNSLDLGIYDYKTRTYDPALGRFMQVDPAADLMRRFSPYAYAFDNPIRFTDPDGMIPEESNGGSDDDDKKKKEEQQKKDDEKKRQELLKQARKNGDLVTIYQAPSDATKNDNSQAKAKVIASMAKKSGVNIKGVLDILSKANDSGELGYKSSSTNFQVNNFKAGRIIGQGGGLLSLATIGNNVLDENYGGAIGEGGKWAAGRYLGGPGVFLGEAFIAVGESQMPEEALQHAQNARSYYKNGVIADKQGMTNEAKKWYKLAAEEERRASNAVQYMSRGRE